MCIRNERRAAPPARLFFGVITGFEELFHLTRDRIQSHFGELVPEEESPLFTFPQTRTYARTMGEGPLQRKFFFLRAHWPQDGLGRVKLKSIEMEEEIQASRSFPVPRAVNIDPGLLNDCRIILATTKDHAHRLYRGDGIWEEVTLVYRRSGGFQPLPWTYPDFRNPRYAAYFTPIRARHLESLKNLNPPGKETSPPPERESSGPPPP